MLMWNVIEPQLQTDQDSGISILQQTLTTHAKYLKLPDYELDVDVVAIRLGNEIIDELLSTTLATVHVISLQIGSYELDQIVANIGIRLG